MFQTNVNNSYKAFQMDCYINKDSQISILVFWVVTPWGLVGRYQCPEDGDSMFLQNIDI
jgi:hypothetical protein